MHTGKQKQMNASYQASLVNRHIRRFTGIGGPRSGQFRDLPIINQLEKLKYPNTYYERGRRPSEFSLNMRIFSS